MKDEWELGLDYIVDNKAGIFEKEKSVLDVFRSRVQKAINDNKELRIKIAVGFFFFEGFVRVYKELKKAYERGLLKEFKLIMGPETRKSTIEILEMLKSDASNLDEESFKFLKDLYEKKIFDFRIFTSRNFHIKLYIFKIGDGLEVWAGSANFTEGGLEENIELIVPAQTSRLEERELYEKFFEKLWENSSDSLENLRAIDIINEIGNVVKEGFIYLEPRIFIANLIKLLKKEKLLEIYSSIGSYLFEFQKMTLDLVEERLDRYGGCILSNSVGLGKTDISCTIAKKFLIQGKRVLIIVPPVLQNHWRNVMKKVGIEKSENIVLLSMGLLQKSGFEVNKYRNFDLIIVDEAHHYRIAKPKSNRRKNLEEICRINPEAKVLLVTATPINISLSDLTNLLRLFIRGIYERRVDEEGISRKIKDVERAVKEGREETVINQVEDLIRKFVVRVTWIDVVNYFKQDLLKISNVDKFEMPDVEKVEYSYDTEIVRKIFNKIVNFLLNLNYEYTKLWKGEYYEEDVKYLAGWFRWRMYKRLESSIYAFEESLKRMRERNKFLIEIFTSNKIKYSELFSKERIKTMFETYKSLSEKQKENVIRNLEKDIGTIEKMLKEIEDVKSKVKRDRKIEKLIEILKKENKPTVIFTESRDTANYIYSNLKEKGFKNIGLVFGGEMDFVEELDEDPFIWKKFKKSVGKIEAQKKFNSGQIDILVTTDILSEGVDLPRADVIINFDLPYNPVRLIQRAGRALRINNPKKIKIYNFVPDKSIDKELELLNLLDMRIKLIMYSIGTDFIFWLVKEKKFDDFSEKNRQRFLEFYREWKEILATRNPEELNKIGMVKLDKEDLELRKFIEHFKISKETVEKYARNYSKPIYTVLKSENKGYFVVYEVYDNGYKYVDYVGNLVFSSEADKSPLNKEEFEKIKSKILEREGEKTKEMLRAPESVYRGKDKEIIDFIRESFPNFEGKISLNSIPQKDKEEIYKEIAKISKLPPFIQDSEKEKILKKLLSYAGRKVSEDTREKGFVIRAIIKYV